MNQIEMLQYMLENVNNRVVQTHFSDGIKCDGNLSWGMIIWKDNNLTYKRDGQKFMVAYDTQAIFEKF